MLTFKNQCLLFGCIFPFKDSSFPLVICSLISGLLLSINDLWTSEAHFSQVIQKAVKREKSSYDVGCSAWGSRTAEVLPFYLEPTRTKGEIKSHLFSSSSTLTLDIFLEISSLNLALKGSECLLFLPMISFMWSNKEKQETRKSLAGKHCPCAKGKHI